MKTSIKTSIEISSALRANATLWFLPIGILLVLVSLLLALFLGVADIPPSDVVAVLGGKSSVEAAKIIMDIRFPRIVTGLLAGMHFAIAGLILQTITRNPLADPSIMGISQGATCAIAIFLFFSIYHNLNSYYVLVESPLEWLPAIGTLGGIVSGGIIYLLAFRLDLGPLRITLCGIAVGTVLQALAIGLIAGWGSDRLEILLEWLSGSLYARTWRHALLLGPFTVVGLAVLPLIRRPMELMSLEATIARSFGLSYRRHFSFALLLACAFSASAVGTVGPIIFVGLIVPHLARFIAGKYVSLHIPLTISLGAIVTTLGDLIGRLVGQAEEIPIGVVTAICGVPLLIALLRKTL